MVEVGPPATTPNDHRILLKIALAIFIAGLLLYYVPTRIMIEVIFSELFWALVEISFELCFGMFSGIAAGDGEGCGLCAGGLGMVGMGIWRLMVGVGEAVGIDMDGDGDTDGIDQRAEQEYLIREGQKAAEDTEYEWNEDEFEL